MSRFSGVSDFYDTIFMHHDFDYIKKCKVYIGFTYNKDTWEIIPGRQLHIESIKDCIPYYPYVVSVASYDKNGGAIYLTEKSWIDIEEERYGHMQIHDYYRQELLEEIQKFNMDGGNQ